MNIISWHNAYKTALVSLWNEVFSDVYPMREELFVQNSFTDINIFTASSGIAINENYEVIGFVVGKCFQQEFSVEIPRTVAWIQCLVVKQAYRYQGIGSLLLAHAEAGFMEAGMTEIKLGSDLYHYFPGIPLEQKSTTSFFERRGYTYQGEHVDMYRDYNGEEGKMLPFRKDITYSLLDVSEKDIFLKFFRECFPGRWAYEVIDYFAKGGTGREFVVMKKAGKIIGFCRINDASSPIIAQNVYWAPLFDSELGGIGPLGIDSTERGRGYGLSLVEAGVAMLRQRGIQHIIIDWTDLVSFYQKLGFDVWKQYTSYAKILT